MAANSSSILCVESRKLAQALVCHRGRRLADLPPPEIARELRVVDVTKRGRRRATGDEEKGLEGWLFPGSLRAGKRAAAIMSLVQSAKLNGHDPSGYLKDVRSGVANRPERSLISGIPIPAS